MKYCNYRLSKTSDTSAIIDVSLSQSKSKKSNLTLFIFAVILGYTEFAVLNKSAYAEFRESENYQTELIDKRFFAAFACLRLMDKITMGITDAWVYNEAIDKKTQSYIEAFEGFCKPLPDSILEPWEDLKGQ